MKFKLQFCTLLAYQVRFPDPTFLIEKFINCVWFATFEDKRRIGISDWPLPPQWSDFARCKRCFLSIIFLDLMKLTILCSFIFLILTRIGLQILCTGTLASYYAKRAQGQNTISNMFLFLKYLLGIFKPILVQIRELFWTTIFCF